MLPSNSGTNGSWAVSGLPAAVSRWIYSGKPRTKAGKFRRESRQASDLVRDWENKCLLTESQNCGHDGLIR
jgi:hypothetical protein